MKLVLENYVKAVLYAFPLLDTVEQDYDEHILNRAILSYGKAAAEAAEYIVGEIVEKGRLMWLKGVVESVLQKLSDVERTLIAIRYFKKERKIKTPALPVKGSYTAWSESKYFRFQQRLGRKVGAMLKMAGVTKELFEAVFATMEMFEKLYRFVCEGKDKGVSKRERRWLGF